MLYFVRFCICWELIKTKLRWWSTTKSDVNKDMNITVMIWNKIATCDCLLPLEEKITPHVCSKESNKYDMFQEKEFPVIERIYLSNNGFKC